MDNYLLASIVVFLILAVAFCAMVIGWRIRVRKSRGAHTLDSAALSSAATTLAEESGLYVATTRSEEPLERFSHPGLAFRGRVRLVVLNEGVLIQVTGEPEVFVPQNQLRSVGTSTWTIDRVVEPGGLIRLDWTLGEDALESYFRFDDSAVSAALIAHISTIIPALSEKGLHDHH